MTNLFRAKELIATVLPAAVVFCAVTALDISTANAGDQEAERSKSESGHIMALETMWSDKFAEGDLEWIVNVHATDAIQLPSGAGIIQGREALKAAWEGMINTEGLEITWQSTAAFVSASSDMAYDYGSGKVKNPDGSVQDLKYVVVWTREDGGWKVALDMFNFNGPPAK